VDLLGKSFELKVHFSTELKPRFTAEQNECGVSFSVMYSVTGPVRTIQSVSRSLPQRLWITVVLCGANYTHVFCVFFYCLERNLLLEKFSRKFMWHFLWQPHSAFCSEL